MRNKYKHGFAVGSGQYNRMYYLCKKYKISIEEYCKNQEKYDKKLIRSFKQTEHNIIRNSKEYSNMMYYVQKHKITVEEFCKNKEKYTKKYQRKKHLNYECRGFEYNKTIYLKRKYGIDLEEYYKILESQNNCCIICGIHESKMETMLSVDHCHTTGKIRGLLCHNCNIGLGNFKDDPKVMKKAIEYLLNN